MLNINSPLMAELGDKVYRDAYVGSQIRMTLPLQIRGLRESFGWTQARLATEARMAQPRISELETPGERRLTIETLLRLASAFDVALQVRFVPFSELIEWSEDLDLNDLAIKRFSEEVAELTRSAAQSIKTHKRITKRRREHQKRSGHDPVIVRTGNAPNYAGAQSGNVGTVQTLLHFEAQLDYGENPFTEMPQSMIGAGPKKALVEPLIAVGAGGYDGR